MNVFSSIKDWSSVVHRLGEIVELVCNHSEGLVASVVIGLLGGITHILQHLRTNHNQGNNIKNYIYNIKVTLFFAGIERLWVVDRCAMVHVLPWWVVLDTIQWELHFEFLKCLE